MKTLQNYFETKVAIDWAIGTGKRYVTTLPTPTSGWLVVSPNNSTLREIVAYNVVGTDGTGNFVTLTERGVGGTTEQTHSVNEAVNMNITAQHWADIYVDPVFTGNVTVPTPTDGTDAVTKDYADGLAIAGAPDSSTGTKGISKLSTAPVSATDPIAVGDNDPRVPTQGENDALVGTSGTPSSTNKYVTDADTTGTGSVVRSSLLSSYTPLLYSYTAGETISAGDCFFISSGQPITRSMFYQPISTQIYNTGYNIGDSSTTVKAGQTFVAKDTSINLIKFIANNSGTSAPVSAQITIAIFATSGGAPTGSAIWSEAIPAFTINGWSQQNVNYKIATPPTLTVGTTYCISFEGNSGNSLGVSYNNAGGVSGVSAYTYNGTSWTQQATTDLTLEMYNTITSPTEGRAYVSEGFTQGEHNTITGIARSTATTGNTFTAITDGFVDGNSFGTGVQTISSTITESSTAISTNASLYTGSSEVKQIFRTQDIANLTKLDIYAQKVNGGGGDVTVKVYDFYTQNLVATGTIADGVITTTAGWFSCTFSTPIQVKSNWSYYYELTASSGNSSTNYYSISLNNANSYDYGFAYVNSVWQPTYDFAFRWYTTTQVNWSAGDPLYLGYGTLQLASSSIGIVAGTIINSTTYKIGKDDETYQFVIDSNLFSNTLTSLYIKHQIPKKIKKAIVYLAGTSSRINVNQEVQKFGINSQYVSLYYGTNQEIASTISFDNIQSSFIFSWGGGTASYKIYLYS
jgi:hypothetical protein